MATLTTYTRNVIQPILDEAIIYAFGDAQYKHVVPFLLTWISPKDQIKTIRKAVRDKYKRDKVQKELWEQIFKTVKYGVYSCPSKTINIGKSATHHLLGGDGIGREFARIIPSGCTLRFKLDAFDLHSHTVLQTLNLSRLFEHPSQMAQLIDDRLYTSNLCISINGICDSFWCKTLNKSALNEAMGVEVSDYIMRYREQILVSHGGGQVDMVISGANVGVGPCNFYPKGKKNIKGHQMIHFEQEHIPNYTITFYVRNGAIVNISDIQITLQSEKRKDSNALVLFPGKQHAQFMCDVSSRTDEYIQHNNGYSAVHDREQSNNVISSGYDPRFHFARNHISQQYDNGMGSNNVSNDGYPFPVSCADNYHQYNNGYSAVRGQPNNVMSYRHDPMLHMYNTYGEQRNATHYYHQPSPQYNINRMDIFASNDETVSVASHQSSLYQVNNNINSSTSTFNNELSYLR